ncbi:MAG: hypothetical protein WAW13_02585 [Minisyncoccia bacterium]
MSAHSEAPSSKSLYLILVSTFFFGVLTGVIVFLQNNTGGEGDGSLNTNTKGFEILAYTYGGCERVGCASYRVIQDGSYDFMVRGRDGQNTKFEGELDRDTLSALKAEIDVVNFEKIMNTEFAGRCPIESDGIAFRYDITYKGIRFSFDSCKENLSDESFFKILLEYFPLLEERAREGLAQ